MAVKGHPSPPGASYTDGSTVTPGAGALPDGATRALQVTVAGSLTVTFVDGTNVAFAAVPVGELRWSVTHVTAASATVVALY